MMKLRRRLRQFFVLVFSADQYVKIWWNSEGDWDLFRLLHFHPPFWLRYDETPKEIETHRTRRYYETNQHVKIWWNSEGDWDFYNFTLHNAKRHWLRYDETPKEIETDHAANASFPSSFVKIWWNSEGDWDDEGRIIASPS